MTTATWATIVAGWLAFFGALVLVAPLLGLCALLGVCMALYVLALVRLAMNEAEATDAPETTDELTNQPTNKAIIWIAGEDNAGPFDN